MSDFISEGGFLENLSLSTSPVQQTVYIQLGESSKRANVFRDEFEIPVFELDQSVLDDFFSGRPTVDQKIVSQSIPAGTVVKRGTAVDIVLSEPSLIPGGIVASGHVALAQQTVGTIYSDLVADDTEVLSVLARNPDPTKMSSTDQALLVRVAEQHDINIGDEPGQTVVNFATSLHFANTMQS
ncbi:hypothetical protein BH18ACT4_BH18ACT4_06250 [soil metagenome]